MEIAASRFPAEFGGTAAQTDLCSQVHVFTELTCTSLLARWCDVAFKAFCRKPTDILGFNFFAFLKLIMTGRSWQFLLHCLSLS